MPSPTLSKDATLLMVPEIRALIEEGRELTSEDFRRIAVVMKVSLSTTTTSGNVTYRPPNTHRLLVETVHPHIVFTDPASETDPLNAISTDHYANLERFKASNARVTLENQDTVEKLVGENAALALNTLINNPLDWRGAPHILLQGQTLKMDVSLVNTGASFVGGATEYGLVLSGLLVRVRAS